MQNPFNQESVVYKFFNFLGHLMILNICFIITSLPLVTIGAASAALMYSFKHDMSFRDFFKGFKENWKKATACWVVSLFEFAIVVVDFMFFLNHSNITAVQVIPLFLLLFSGLVIYCWGTAYTVFFDISLGSVIKNSLILGIAKIVRTISLVVTVLLFPAIFIFFPEFNIKFGFIWFAFGFALMGYSNYLIVKPVFLELSEK